MPSTEGGMVAVGEGDQQVVVGRNGQCFQPGLKPTEVISSYSDWAHDYDTMMCPGRYNGPSMAANEVEGLVPHDQRQHTRILDVAAGTGQVGHELHARGFREIDAMEPSEGMLRLLEDTGVYRTKYQEFLGVGLNSVPDDSYDVTVIVGAFGEGHIPVQGVMDLIRLTKPGGFVVNVMRLEYLEEVEAYKGKLEPYMDLLVQKGYWKKVSRKVLPDYFCRKDGVVFVHKVL